MCFLRCVYVYGLADSGVEKTPSDRALRCPRVRTRSVYLNFHGRARMMKLEKVLYPTSPHRADPGASGAERAGKVVCLCVVYVKQAVFEIKLTHGRQ